MSVKKGVWLHKANKCHQKTLFFVHKGVNMRDMKYICKYQSNRMSPAYTP